MLKIRGGHRFEGYGNVKIATEHGTRSGWQLACSECKKLSEVIHRTGSSFPPKILTRIFSDRGWKVGNNAEGDVCPECREKRRQKNKEERKQFAKGNVDRLLDTIRQADLMLASNVAIDYGPYQPQIAAQLKSLFETAYLCNMLPRGLLGEFNDFWKDADEPPPTDEPADVPTDVSKVDTSPAPPPLPAPIMPPAVVKPVTGISEWQYGTHIDSLPQHRPPPEPPPPEPPPPPPEPPPPPSPPGQGEHRISPRTAAFLAEVRREVFKNRATQ
jgi:hypothetical protein